MLWGQSGAKRARSPSTTRRGRAFATRRLSPRCVSTAVRLPRAAANRAGVVPHGPPVMAAAVLVEIDGAQDISDGALLKFDGAPLKFDEVGEIFV